MTGPLAKNSDKRSLTFEFDDTAIWIAHTCAAGGPGGSVAVAVGKVFGKTYMDLAVEDVNFLPEVVRPGGNATAFYVVADRGDGAAPASQAEVTLVDEAGGSYPVASSEVPPLAPGAASAAEVDFTVPENLSQGAYQVCVTVDLGLPATVDPGLPATVDSGLPVIVDQPGREYSRQNNQACAPSPLYVQILR